MKKCYYKIGDHVKREKLEEGAILSKEGDMNVVCLGMFESELLDAVLTDEIERVIYALEMKYQGDEIRNDVMGFCDQLRDMGFLESEER